MAERQGFARHSPGATSICGEPKTKYKMAERQGLYQNFKKKALAFLVEGFNF